MTGKPDQGKAKRLLAALFAELPNFGHLRNFVKKTPTKWQIVLLRTEMSVMDDP